MVKIVGHRGSGHHATQNTLTSFKKAIELGLDRAELDVQCTKDKKIIVFHDLEVSKLTTGTGFINELTSLEIKKIRYKTGGEIPTLQEVFDLCKHKIDLQIELKGECPPKMVNELILANEMENQVVITSFQADLLQKMKKINPNLKVGLLFNDQKTVNKIEKLTKEIPLDFLAPFVELVDENFFNISRNLQKKVYAYRVNDKKTGEKLISMGIDAIGTDFPEFFMKKQV